MFKSNYIPIILKCYLINNNYRVKIINPTNMYKNIDCVISKNIRYKDRLYIINSKQLEYKNPKSNIEFYYINNNRYNIVVLTDMFDIGNNIIKCDDIYNIIVNKKMINGITHQNLINISSTVCLGNKTLKDIIQIFEIFI